MAVPMTAHHLDTTIEKGALSGVEEMPKPAFMPLPVPNRNYRLRHTPAQRFFAFPPENVDRLRIPIRNDATGIHGNDGV